MNTVETSPPPLHWYSRLHNQVFLALILGVILGLLFGESAVSVVGWMGTIFIRLLRMVIVPLIFTSIVSGVSSVGSGAHLGRLGLKTFIYYIGTSLLAAMLGLTLVNLIRPGIGANLVGAATQSLPQLQTPDSMAEIFVRLIPINPVEAMSSGDMLAIIFFGIVLGVGLAHMREDRAAPLISWFNSGFELMMKVTGGIIRLAPLGVLGLITRAVASSGLEGFKSLALYMFTIALGLTLHMFVTMPLLLKFVGRINPLIHFRNMSEALLMAFSTSSSSATLPVTMRCVEKKVGVSNQVTSFVLPMGATINMDGTALYECVGVIFIAQVLGFDLSLSAQILVVFTALLASIGAAGIPSAGLVMIFIITDAIGLTSPEVGVIVGTMLAIDRPLDMYRTMVNIWGDSCGAAIIARSEGESQVDAVVSQV